MMSALLAFYAPWRRLAGIGLLAAATTGTWLALETPLPLMPYVFVCLVWAGSAIAFGAAQPSSDWERAWPVRPHTLLWTRTLGSCLLGWVALVAPLAVVSAGWALGTVSESDWLAFSYHAVLLLGAVPLVSVLVTRLQLLRGVPWVPIVIIVQLGLTLRVYYYAFFPSYQLPTLPLTLGLGSAALIAVLLAAVSLWLMPLRGLEPVTAGLELGPSQVGHQRQEAGVQPKAARSPRFVLAQFFYLDASPYPAVAWCGAYSLLTSPFSYQAKGYLWLSSIAFGFWVYVIHLPAHLPVSRQRLLAYFLAPIAVIGPFVFSVEYARYDLRALYAQPLHAETQSWNLDRLPQGIEPQRLTVPNLLWRATWGEPPLIGAPGGPLHRPTAYPVVRGLPLQVYNPYQARFDDDPVFVTRQISRALSESTRVEVSTADVTRACERFDPRLEFPLQACVVLELTRPYRPPLAWRVVTAWVFSMLVLQSLLTTLALLRRPFRKHALAIAVTLLGGVLALGLATAVDVAVNHMIQYDPSRYFDLTFGLGVLLAELARLVERAPFVMALLGLGTLAAMYGRLLSSFRNAEIGRGARARA
jgi:hypothetical protein